MKWMILLELVLMKKTTTHQLTSVAKDDQMAETLIKLFKKPHPVSPSTLPKAKGKSSSKTPSLNLITKVIETNCSEKNK